MYIYFVKILCGNVRRALGIEKHELTLNAPPPQLGWTKPKDQTAAAAVAFAVSQGRFRRERG